MRDSVTPRSTSPALLAVVALGACGAEETRNLPLDDLPVLVVQEELRVGNVSDPDLGFTQPYALDVDRDGAIYVADGGDAQIRVFSPDGQLQRRIGRQGDGPGEFRRPPSPFGVKGDTVWAWDSGARRLTLFDRAGTVLSTARVDGVEVPTWSSFGYVLPLAMRPDGLFTSALSLVAGGGDRVPGVQPTDSVPVPRVLFDASGAVVDTLGWDEAPDPQMAVPPSMQPEPFRRVEIAGRRFVVPMARSATPQWDYRSDGRLIMEQQYADAATEGAFTITRVGIDRDTVFHRTYPYTPIPYTEADLDSIAARAARGGPGGGVPYARGPAAPAPPQNTEVIARALRAEMAFPPYRLAVLGFQVGRDESIWLLRDTPDTSVERWVLLDPEGEPRGQIELPANVRVLRMEGDTFWAAVPDELEVPWVVRYRISGG